MKECKLIHINDGNSRELSNGEWFFMEDFPKTEETINKYLSEGYEVKHVIADYTPSKQEEGNYTFYKGGIVIYLEREV